MTGTTLDTPRLILRPPLMQDFDAWADFYADPEAMAYLGGAQARSVSWRAFMAAAGAWTLQGFAMFSVIEKATGEWVGRVGAHFPEAWPGREVGWAIVRSCWGKGYATEAAAASLTWAFESLGWTEVIHCIDAENHASRRVAARLGSTILRQATLPPPVVSRPVDIWGQSAEAWRARSTRSTDPSPGQRLEHQNNANMTPL